MAQKDLVAALREIASGGYNEEGCIQIAREALEALDAEEAAEWLDPQHTPVGKNSGAPILSGPISDPADYLAGVALAASGLPVPR